MSQTDYILCIPVALLVIYLIVTGPSMSPSKYEEEQARRYLKLFTSAELEEIGRDPYTGRLKT
jgi:hypothetical protein